MADDRRDQAQTREALVAQQAAWPNAKQSFRSRWPSPAASWPRLRSVRCSCRPSLKAPRRTRVRRWPTWCCSTPASAAPTPSICGHRRATCSAPRSWRPRPSAGCWRMSIARVRMPRGPARADRCAAHPRKRSQRAWHANQSLGSRYQEAQIEIASLRERLAAADNRAADLQRMLEAQRATAGESRPGQGKPVVKKTRGAPRPGKCAAAGSRSSAASRVNQGPR